MNWLYLSINLFALSFPLARSFEDRVKYYKQWYALFPAIIITGAFFIIWDVIFTINGVWGFNDDYLLGVRIFELPIEEWLFFITIPFASVFIYECLDYFFPNIKNPKVLIPIYYILGITLVIIGLVNTHLAYTFWCFIFCGIFVVMVAYFKPPWLFKFTITYAIHLIPFLLVNGVLTGTITDAPVVWYNNEENLFIRILTIPIEDTIYALLLLLMNIFLLELFRKKMKKQLQ